jgi:anaerobic selenocysteine-containing dehydrogenase
VALRGGGPGQRGARSWSIDPLRTATAEAADWFLQPLPGTDVALALGMLHVLVRDELVDHDYVHQHAVGFDALAEHVAEWTPVRAGRGAASTAADIERLARLYGTTSPAFIRTLIGAEHHEHGAMFFRTLACLPVLTGSWKAPGRWPGPVGRLVVRRQRRRLGVRPAVEQTTRSHPA